MQFIGQSVSYWAEVSRALQELDIFTVDETEIYDIIMNEDLTVVKLMARVSILEAKIKKINTITKDN